MNRLISLIIGAGLILALAPGGRPVLQSIAPESGQGSGESGQASVFLPFVSKGPGCIYCYYVDSLHGSDANAGTSMDEPWRTLAPVQAAHLPPGSVVHLRRGSSWTGGLYLDDSGLPDRPIRITAYGDGPRPVITNPGSASNWTRGVSIRADWIIVEGILIRDVHEAGVYLYPGADHNTIRDLEIYDAGTGVTVGGRYNLIAHNNLHDLHMVRNTPAPGDDFGAVGVKLYDSYNEVAFNRMEHCIAPSLDYGVDGGGVELYGYMEFNNIHHNRVAHSAGFLEVAGGEARHITVAYNVSLDNGRFSYLHLTGHYASDVTDFRIEHNTIVEIAGEENGWVLLAFRGSPTGDTLLARNNIFYADRYNYIANESGFSHGHNLYYLGGGTELGFTLGQDEQVADPQFIDLAAEDFNLRPGSPAIDAGADLGYTFDFEGRPVPTGPAPDLGAFEAPQP